MILGIKFGKSKKKNYLCTVFMVYMAKKKYSLQISLIDKYAIEFIENEGYVCSITEHPNKTITEKHIAINKDKAKGKLVCYISGGQVSYQVQTGNQTIRNIGEKCWEYILEHTKLSDANAKWFIARDVESELFDLFISSLGESYKVTEKERTADSVRNSFLIEGNYGACLSVIFYNNGTLNIQGRITPLFVEIISKAVDDLVLEPQKIKDDFLAIEPAKAYEIDPDIHTHIHDTAQIDGSKLETMIRTSIQLANCTIELDDYCCYTHSILRALEGLIRKRLAEEEPDVFENVGDYFKMENNSFVFKDEYTRFDGCSAKNPLEEAYDFYNKNRHAISHVDKANIEASKMMDYDEAVDVIQECLKRINKLCNNWN